MIPQLIREKLASQNADDQWRAIMAILDQAADAEVGFICGAGIVPDERTHSAGRLDAILSTKKLLEDEKENASKTL
tara:strand:- start:2375 stop:2602 length:228 start_codon:yes stop_codon:yes gene_type:complete